jgi:hypothetical protein
LTPVRKTLTAIAALAMVTLLAWSPRDALLIPLLERGLEHRVAIDAQSDLDHGLHSALCGAG